MTTRPTASPLFATDATFTAGAESGLPPRVDPGAGFRAQGWYPNTRFASRHFNFLRGIVGDWLAYLAEKTDHQFNVLNYGADKTGGSNAHTAWQNANDAALAAGGGEIVVPPGIFRLDSGFTLNQGVSLLMAPNAIAYLNHATADFITLAAGTYTGAPSVIRGGTFEALVDNTGRVLVDPSGGAPRAWSLQGVAVNTNTNKLKGPVLEQLGPSHIRLDKCLLASAAASTGDLVRQNNASAYLEIDGGRLIAPATAWTGRLLSSSNGRGHARGVHFDMRALTGTGARAFWLTSGFMPWELTGNLFEAPAFTQEYLRWTSGAQLVESGNQFFGGSLPIGAYADSSGDLAAGSRLGSMGAVAVSFGAVATITVPKGYREVVVHCTAASGPALEMPSGWFAGQELLLTYFNPTAAGTISFSGAGASVTGNAIPSILAGNTLTGVFVWEDRDVAGGPTPGSRWIQKGGWGVGLTLA